MLRMMPMKQGARQVLTLQTARQPIVLSSVEYGVWLECYFRFVQIHSLSAHSFFATARLLLIPGFVLLAVRNEGVKPNVSAS